MSGLSAKCKSLLREIDRQLELLALRASETDGFPQVSETGRPVELRKRQVANDAHEIACDFLDALDVLDPNCRAILSGVEREIGQLKRALSRDFDSFALGGPLAKVRAKSPRKFALKNDRLRSSEKLLPILLEVNRYFCAEVSRKIY